MKLKNYIKVNMSKGDLSVVFMIIIFNLSLILVSCENETPVCPHCNDDDNDNEQSAMVANISGAYNLKFDSESFEYHNFDFKEYIMREIIAKMYFDTTYMEIRLTFNDYSNGNKNYNFDGSQANASVSVYSMPAEYFQYKINGTIYVSNCNDSEISATFEFSATTIEEGRKLIVSQGVINYQKTTP